MKKLLLVLVILSVQSIYASSAGETVYTDKKINCAQCHGKDGMGMAKDTASLGIVKGPRIAGLPAEYIEAELKSIQGKDKANVRKTKFTSMMKTRISKLSEQEMKDLAAYVSTMINPSAGAYKSEIWPR